MAVVQVGGGMPPPPPVLPPAPADLLATANANANASSTDDSNLPPVSPYAAVAAAAAAAAPQIPESEFIEQVGEGPVTVTIVCPVAAPSDDASVYGLQGQSIEVQLPQGVRTSVKDLKLALSPLLSNMPPSKQQFKEPARGFLKDTSTLAFYNLGTGTSLELVPRKRGRR